MIKFLITLLALTSTLVAQPLSQSGSDVSLVAPGTGKLLMGTTGAKGVKIVTGQGGTALGWEVNSSGNLTPLTGAEKITGTTFDGTLDPSFSDGSVAFANPAGELTQDAAGLSFNSSANILTATGGLRGGSGTAAEPGLAFSTDTDTGLFRNGANEIGVSTAGTSRYVINSSGITFVATAGTVFTKGAYTAAGSVQGDATAISGTMVQVNGADGTKGVILPAGTAGQIVYIVNNSASDLKLYPPSGGNINSGATNAAITVSAGMRVCSLLTSGQWNC